MLKFKSETWLNRKAVKAAVSQAVLPPLHDAGLLVRNDAVRSMKQGGKLGGAKQHDRGYYNSFLKRYVVASPPGKPPHAQTKTLRKSIRSVMARNRKSVVVGPTRIAWYGRVHEFGTRKLPKRPFMRPALYRMINRFPALFRKLGLGNTRAGRALNREAARRRRMK